MRAKWLCLLAVGIAIAVFGPAANAQRIGGGAIEASQGTWVDLYNPDSSFSTSTWMAVSADCYVGYVKFNLASWQPPAGYQVGYVAMHLVATGTWPTVGLLWAHETLTDDWDAANVTWNNQPGYVADGLSSIAPAFEDYLDVTSAFNTHRGGYLGIAIVATSNNLINWLGSANHTNSAYRPTLFIYVDPVPAAPVFSAADLKGVAEGASVSCQGVVTAVFSDCFYIESSDRNCGIRVDMGSIGGSYVGRTMTVSGNVQKLDSGECYINTGNGSIEVGGTGVIVTPLSMTNKSLGGAAYGLQSGVSDGAGLNNTGILVRTTGSVTTKDTGGQWFKISDGSGVDVTVYGSVPEGNPYVIVTGISSCEKDSSLNIQRVILATNVQAL